MGLMAQAIVARVCIPQLRLIVPMPGGLASQARGVALRDRCRGCIEGRGVFRGGTVSMGRMVSLGVLACRHRRTVLSRVRGSLVRQFMGLMAQAIVARVCISQLRLIVHMPVTLASEARDVAISDRRRGSVDRRRVFRGGTVTMVRTAFVRVQGGLGRRFKRLKCARGRILKMRLIVQMPGGCASEARGNAIRDRCPDGIDGRRVSRYSVVNAGCIASVGIAIRPGLRTGRVRTHGHGSLSRGLALRRMRGRNVRRGGMVLARPMLPVIRELRIGQ